MNSTKSTLILLLVFVINAIQSTQINDWIQQTFLNIPLCNTTQSCQIEFNETNTSLNGIFVLSSFNLPLTISYQFELNDLKFTLNKIELEIENITILQSDNQPNLIELIWPGSLTRSMGSSSKCIVIVNSHNVKLTQYEINLTPLQYLHKIKKRSIAKIKFSRNQFNFKCQYPTDSDQIGKLTLNLIDQDLFTNSNYNITFKATRDLKSQDLFYLDQQRLEIKLNSTSRWLQNNYQSHFFRVFINDLTQNKNLLTSCSVKIDCMNSNQTNKAPQFETPIYEAQIVENNAPDTLVTRVEANDDDFGENGHLTYHFVTSDESTSYLNTKETFSLPFQIKSDTGEIYAKKILNRELKDFYKLNVMAIDNGSTRLSCIAQVNVRVLAQADDSPKFTQKEFNLTLADNADYWLKPTVLKVAALDADNSSNLIYSLSGSLNDMNTFEIDSQNGLIRLVAKLNSELKNQYKLNIIAKDLSQPSRATYAPLTIFIEDVHVNPPVFTAPFYEFILFENAPIGCFVGRVLATDRRKRSFDSLIYSIQSDLVNDPKFPFSINENNGTIETVKKISRNFKHGYEFNVVALIKNINKNSVANSSVRVKVKILDINDQVPLFAKSFYKINITEESAIGLPLLTLNTKNANSMLDYSIESGNENEMFSLVKQDNDRAFLTLERSNLNYKKQSIYDLNIKVMDQDGLYSMANVVVNIMPKDSNMPRFSKDIYNFQIYENAQMNSLVGSIQASSTNSVDIYSSRIVYKLIQNIENSNEQTEQLITSRELNDLKSSYFKLDELTGNLYVSQYLDREKFESITLYVTATNYNDKSQLNDHAIVQIQLLDVNDNAPVFTRQFYELNIYRNFKANTYLTRVEAIDKDLNQNGLVRYSIENSTQIPVVIDPISGIIRLNQFQEGFLNLTLVASDLGEPSLSTKSNLLVTFINEDDLAPVFDRNILTFYLFENQPIGSIIGEIKARDPDSGKQANIIYKLLDNYDLFELKPSVEFNTVNLATKFIPDIEINGRNVFEITLRAYSSVSLHTDCLVRIHLRDINDNALLVPKSFKIVFNNYKNYFLTEKSAFVPINDKDLFSNLTFRLLDSVGKQVVDLDSKSGKLKFKPILNSNNQINVSFMIGINDGFREMVSTCELMVLMLSDTLIAESVTLSLPNLDSDLFLNLLYDRLVASLLKIVPKSSVSNIHIFNLVTSSYGLNISLAVSYDYEKDIFMPSNILKQIIYLNSETIESDLQITKLAIYEDTSCAIEPCLNYQQCTSSIKFQSASQDFLHSSYMQFRPIQVKHDFKCACPTGFTGNNSSFMCDLEINLCYSNPCGNNGVCISLESSFMCLCDAGFTGRLCEFNMKKLKCCESEHQAVTKPSHLISNKKSLNITQTTAGKCAASTSDSSSYNPSATNFICKGDSKCKNLILGGVVCDKCGTSIEDKAFYNQFCELRTKHFPANKRSYLALAGIQNRFRFKIKLTFATVKSDGFLFYNGRLNRQKNDFDFVALKIENSHLKFSYSLGENFANELILNELDVTDGKWRTVTVQYHNQNVSISVDNDNSVEIDSCELASNMDKSTSDCYRLNTVFKLPDKCFNPIETCFRYFDLNGPLKLGQGPDSNRDYSNKSYYEGCISDVYLNEKLIDLKRDAIVDYNTEIGCSPKQNLCNKINHQCTNCQHVWSNKINCNCDNNQSTEESFCVEKSNQENVFNLRGTGYIALKDLLIKNHTEQQFSIRIPKIKSSETLILAQYDLFTKINDLKDKSQTFYLTYSQSSKRIKLISENIDLSLLELAFHLDDMFWHSFKVNIFVNSNKAQIELKIDEYFKTSSNLIQLEFESTYFKTYIGGNANLNNKLTASSITGCIKQIEQESIILRETVDMQKGCSISTSPCDSPKCQLESKMITNACVLNEPACFNNGNCSSIENGTINCICPNGFKGKYCQYENKGLIRNLLTNQNNCPAKWWGREPGICGPCNCDESKNFSPDCNKSSGQCECKPKFYKKYNKITKEEQCVPCDCYLEGSISLQCESVTGQCSCLTGAGITGRKCDQCVSPFAEMTSKGNECRQLSSNECPKTFKFDILWPRTSFNIMANSSCPKGSIGTAFRYCNELNGWSTIVDLRDCKSLKLIDSQLTKWSKMLIANNSQLNSYQALQLVEDLNQITLDAELDDDLDDLELTENYFATSPNSLYANDLIIIKNLTKYIIQYEIDNAPSFLYIQDKHFLQNIFSTLNRILSKKYEKKLKQLLLSAKSFQNDTFVENGSSLVKFQLTDLVVVLDKYLQSIILNDQYNSLTDKIEISLNNLKLFMVSVKGQAFAQTMQNVKFKLITTQNSMQKINFITMNILPTSLPNSLVLESEKHKKISHNYRVVSNLLMINLQHSSQKSEIVPNSTKTLYIVVDFVISNLFETTYDYSSDKVNYRNLRMSDANYLCVHLNQDGIWSNRGAKLVSYDFETNTVKCSYDHFSVYAVVTSVNGFVNLGSKPINFSLITYILMPAVYLIHLISIVVFLSLRKSSSPLTQIYLNLCVNILIMQVIFLYGVNSNSSHLLCKFISIAQHFFHLSSYLWLFLIVVHLYRMLTEIRDINKSDSSLPVFYYTISIVIPALVVSLTLGIKQEIYTNYTYLQQLYNGNAFSSYFSSTLYCWLCTNSTNFYDIFYVFILPISIISLFLLIFTILCYNESKRTTFKQAEVPFVTQNLLSCILLLPAQFLISFLIIMTVFTAGSYSSHKEFNIYQYLYLGSSIFYSLLIFAVLIIGNKSVKKQIKKSWSSTCTKNLNESLDTSKLKLYNRSPNLKEPKNAPILNRPEFTSFNPDMFKMNPKYILDYRDFQANSISTTTTSGTIDDVDYQCNYMKDNLMVMGISNSNGYLSHLANTTNTESTANESDFTSQFDFNRAPLQSNSQISESDVIDVGKILKTRMITSQTVQLLDQSDSMDNYQIRNEFTKGQIIEKQPSQAVKKTTPSLSLFWPNTVAECDTSFLDGSAVYSPTKLPYAKSIVQVPDILTVSATTTKLNTINRNLQKNNSYNSNSSNSHSNNFSNSTSSLILNSNSMEQTHNSKTEIFTPQKLVAILTHSGSPTTSDNESGNETRV